MLEQRYGAGVSDRQNAMFDAAGLPHADRREKVPNSRRALMLGELARERGVFDALHPRLFDAYWARARDIGDAAVLIEEGVASGLDEAEVTDVLDGERYLDEQLRSLLAQTHRNWVLYWHDDGSSDSTVALMEAFAHGPASGRVTCRCT